MADVFGVIRECRACPAVRPGPILPASAEGPAPAIMLVGEAPGRRGAGRTGIPFEGDEAGRRLDEFLAEAGLGRHQVYITNAVLCFPIGTHGNNRSPFPAEIRRCSPNLAAQVDRVRPPVIVTLGGVALKATDLIMPHGLQLKRAAGVPAQWSGTWLVPMFHPGRQSTLHRPGDVQREDWRRVGRWLVDSRLVPDSAPR